MPTYAYACTACDHRFEIFQSFNEDSLTTCPECTGRLRKLFNAVGVVFKGSGFYRTDSRSGSAPASGGSASKATEPKGGDAKGGDATGGSAGKDSSSPAPAASAAAGGSAA